MSSTRIEVVLPSASHLWRPMKDSTFDTICNRLEKEFYIPFSNTKSEHKHHLLAQFLSTHKHIKYPELEDGVVMSCRIKHNKKDISSPQCMGTPRLVPRIFVIIPEHLR